MTTAAIYCQDNAYDTKQLFMGRQIAGIEFMRAMARYTDGDDIYLYASSKKEFNTFQSRIDELAGKPRPCVWIPHTDVARLAKPGTLYFPSPHIASLAWERRFPGPRTYSLCGVTHTLCTASVFSALGDYLIAPLETWDALICTSRAAKAAVERLFADWGEYLAQRFGGGAARVPVQMPVIPLGVDCDSFAPRKTDAKTRTALRRKLGIAKDGIAVLFMGRMSYFEKAHPMPLYLALEEAAKRTGKSICLIMAGWFANDTVKKNYVDGAGTFCPHVKVIFVDGRRQEIRDTARLAADIFTSLSDNVQESFGLTPVEGMASGLPVVVSDWDGYRDTVRDGVDGFAVPTTAPPPGAGNEFAYRWTVGSDSYEMYVGQASFCTAVDVAAAADAFAALISDEGLRRRMGESGRQRAAANYDWKSVIAAYQELWRELGERRAKEPESVPRTRPDKSYYPLRPDPFAAFAGYPTARLSPKMVVARNPAAGADALARVCSVPMNTYALRFLLPAAGTEALLARLAAEGPLTIAAIVEKRPKDELVPLYRTLGWLAKMGLVVIRAP